tara:strand:+ start:583 stop:732 length:150 start_codon:yes stop_codon:yes gene_type:complete
VQCIKILQLIERKQINHTSSTERIFQQRSREQTRPQFDYFLEMNNTAEG